MPETHLPRGRGRAWAAMLATLLLAGCAGAIPGHLHEVSLKQGMRHRECVELAPGEVLSMEFVSTRALDFGIRHEEGGEPRYDLYRGGLKSYDGMFTTREPRYFCMLWINQGGEGRGALRLGYDYRIIKRRSE